MPEKATNPALANEGGTDGPVDLRAEGDEHATVTGADLGATTADDVVTATDVELDGFTSGVPATAPATDAIGYLPLDSFGIAATPIGDEAVVNHDVPAFVYGDRTSTTVGVPSDGYPVVGGATNEDNDCCNLTSIADPARPNN